jgi:Rrf2 family protein
MRVSARTEYACVAMLELAASYGSGQPLRIRSIADAHGIPSRFLVQILLQLKGAGFVVSTRGASGGYRLAKHPEEVTVDEIVTIMEGPVEPAGESASAAVEALRELWQEVTAEEKRMLSEVTFAELAAKLAQESSDMYYI